VARGSRRAAPSVHPWAEGGFGRAAEAYELGRPGYPAAALDFIAARLELAPGRVVVDLGAGTGKLSRLLGATGARVVAVEPVSAMRALIPARIDAMEGTAEAIPFGDGTVDAVTCAQAFHWFQPGTALSEIHRVLRPGGGLAILANIRSESDPLQRKFLGVLGRYRSHPSLEEASRPAALLAGDRRFTAPELRSVAHVQRLDADAFVAQAASESSIALLDDSTRERALREFRALVDGTDEIELHYVTEVVCTTRRSRSGGGGIEPSPCATSLRSRRRCQPAGQVASVPSGSVHSGWKAGPVGELPRATVPIGAGAWKYCASPQ
jgi:SAM-dependent methyltransferase